MHAQMSVLAEMKLDVQVSEPYQVGDGVHGPDIEVRPLGTRLDGGLYWSFSVAEARELAAMLTQRCDEAEALLGKGG